jgi:DNA polymerase-3 subunit alpha
MTNNGNICGSYFFWKICKAAGIKPILGQEFFVALNDDMKGREEGIGRIVLLAKNQDGWKNLQQLSSLAYLDGFYSKPRIDSNILMEKSNGLIALTGAINGVLGSYWRNGEERRAVDMASKYKRIFKNDFYLEVLPSYLQQQISYNIFLMEVGRIVDVKLVATNNCYYVDEGKGKYHPYLLMIKNNIRSDVFGRQQQWPDDLYLKSEEEMVEGFLKQDFEEATANEWIRESDKIADEVQEIEFEKSFKLPKYSDFKILNGEENEGNIRSRSLFE